MSFYTRKSEKYEGNDTRPPPEHNLILPTSVEIGATRLDWLSAEIQSKLPTDILLLTVKDHEFNSCYSYMKTSKKVIIRAWCDDVGMVDFGEFGDGGVKVALIRCEMGPIPALLLVKNAADILNPKVAIFVGFCATVNPAKAKLGDVVISAKLATYSNKKIAADGAVELRGIKANVSRNMARLILSAKDGWVAPLTDSSSYNVKVHCQAVVLSGPELVNFRERRDELLGHYPDAIALDMEGEGLYSAAYDLGIEWAVIKGISDFADGSKTATAEWQPFASAMAASVLYNMFKYPDVIRKWSHYKKIEPGQAEGNVAAKPACRINQGIPAARNNLIDEFIRGFNPGDSGQFRYYDGRMIKYEVWKRYPSLLSESWEMKYDATATDKTTGITEKRGGFSDASEAVKGTVRMLLEKLQAANVIDYSSRK